MVISYKYPYDLHTYTAFEDTEVRFLKSLPLLQLNNLKKREERKEKIKQKLKKLKRKNGRKKPYRYRESESSDQYKLIL